MILALIGMAGAAVAFLWGGTLALTGFLLAVGVGGIGAAALAGTSWVVGRLMAAQATPKVGTTIIVLAAFVKFPLLVAAWYVAKGQGRAAEVGFVGGILLVYFALVGWAATRNGARP